MKFEDFTYAIRDGDVETVQRLHGLYVGQLSPEELEAFERCVHDGVARRSYSGVGAFLGLAKVVVLQSRGCQECGGTGVADHPMVSGPESCQSCGDSGKATK